MTPPMKSSTPFLCRWFRHLWGWTGAESMRHGKQYRCEREGCTAEKWSYR